MGLSQCREPIVFGRRCRPCSSAYVDTVGGMYDDEYSTSELYRVMPPRRSELREALDANKGSLRQALDATGNPLERITQQTLRDLDRTAHGAPDQDRVVPDFSQASAPGRDSRAARSRAWKWLGGLITLILAAVIAGVILHAIGIG